MLNELLSSGHYDSDPGLKIIAMYVGCVSVCVLHLSIVVCMQVLKVFRENTVYIHTGSKCFWARSNWDGADLNGSELSSPEGSYENI